MFILQQFRSDNFTTSIGFLDLAIQRSWSTLQDAGAEKHHLLQVEDEVNDLNIDPVGQVC
jgi:hypothetical protein